MTINAVIAIVAGGLVLAFGLGVPRLAKAGPKTWMPPAVVSAAFFAFSLYTVVVEGPLGFWDEHTRSFWGNQVWFDLLLGVVTAIYLLVPRAKAVGMRPTPWIVFTFATGCIGLCAFAARTLYLEQQADPTTMTTV